MTCSTFKMPAFRYFRFTLRPRQVEVFQSGDKSHALQTLRERKVKKKPKYDTFVIVKKHCMPYNRLIKLSIKLLSPKGLLCRQMYVVFMLVIQALTSEKILCAPSDGATTDWCPFFPLRFQKIASWRADRSQRASLKRLSSFLHTS